MSRFAPSRVRSVGRLLALAAAFSIGVGGCDYFKGQEPPKPPPVTTAPKTPPKKKKEEPVKAAPATAPPRVMSLSLTPPVATKECLIKLTAAAGSVPAILQVASFADTKSESYPSIFIQATAPSGVVKDILQQPLEAKVYVARGRDGPYFSTPDGQPAQLTLTVADDVHVAGKIENATLVDLVSGKQATVKGEFDGKLK